jgi:hypothetical protein
MWVKMIDNVDLFAKLNEIDSLHNEIMSGYVDLVLEYENDCKNTVLLNAEEQRASRILKFLQRNFGSKDEKYCTQQT